jgi:uncharacterized membrane protein
MDIVVIGVIFIGFILISCVLAIVAFNRTSNLNRKLVMLKSEVGHLADLIANGIQAKPEPGVEIQEIKPEPILAVEPVLASVEAAAEPDPVLRGKVPRDVEQALASRWFVWIGGAAVALGGLLFVKYAHDHGLISPVLRAMLGLVLAAVLVAAGEYVRRMRGTEVVDYVPAALSAAGLVTGFGTIYAAHTLYGLIPSGVAFVGLGLVALGAFALSRLQGPLIAALGLIGAFAAPALVSSSNPNAWAFYPYLFVIVVASFFTLRGRNWWWLGYLAITGATAWSLLWVQGAAFEMGDVVPVGLFALALGGAATFLLEGKRIFADESGSLIAPSAMSHALRLAASGMAASALILAGQVFETAHSFMALVLFAIGMGLVALFSWIKKGWSIAGLLSAAFSLIVLMGWAEVSFQQWAMDESGFWSSVPGLIVPHLFRNWMFVTLTGSTALGAAGYWRKAVPQPWAMLAAGSAFLFLFGAWARADFVMGQGAWAMLGALLTLVLAALAYLRRDRVAEPAYELSIDALLVGAALLALFTLDRASDGVRYTIGVAVLAAAFAWVSRILPARFVGAIVSALGSFAAVRLFVSREFWGEPTGLLFGAHWPLYGYGIPAVLLWWGSRMLSGEKFKQYGTALEGLSLGLAVSLISLELRVLIGGGIVHERFTLLEMSAHILAWMGAAYGLAYRQQLYSSFVSLWGARLLLGVSCAALVAVSLFALNPLITGDRIEGNAFINTLWLAYLAPVVLLALVARKMESLGIGSWRNAIGVLALVLLVAFVTLQTKRAFQGSFLIPEFVSEAESYAMSAMWLLLAVGLFVFGLRVNRQTIRYGGLAVMVLALLKTFAYDLWQLGGLWQIASVMGIGLSLIGIGWLYTRFVKRTDLDMAAT